MKMQVNDWLALLAIFFSVGDIIGATRIKRVEQAWLQYATQFFIFIFRQFSRAKQASLSIAPLLISVTILFIGFLLPLFVTLFAVAKSETEMSYVLLFLSVLSVLLGALASSELMSVLRNRARFYQNGYFTNESPYFELSTQQRIVEVLITSHP